MYDYYIYTHIIVNLLIYSTKQSYFVNEKEINIYLCIFFFKYLFVCRYNVYIRLLCRILRYNNYYYFYYYFL